MVLAKRTQRTVALDQSALLEVMDALKAAEVDDRIRQAAQTIDHAFIEAEVTAVIGAAPHEPQATERESAQLRRPGFAASWGNGDVHGGSGPFADTEEVTGSNPVAPTTPHLSRASADHFVPPMDGDR